MTDGSAAILLHSCLREAIKSSSGMSGDTSTLRWHGTAKLKQQTRQLSEPSPKCQYGLLYLQSQIAVKLAVTLGV